MCQVNIVLLFMAQELITFFHYTWYVFTICFIMNLSYYSAKKKKYAKTLYGRITRVLLCKRAEQK